MRHGISGKKLGRNTAHRKALFSNMVTALFEHDSILTTESKARALRPIAEKLVSKAKSNNLHHRQMVSQTVKNKTVLKRLFDTIAPRCADRHGGYTRIIKLSRRPGDAAFMARLELVDAPQKEEVKPSGKQAAVSDRR